METNHLDYIQGIVEALLFTSEKPVTLEQIKAAINTVGIGVQEVRQSIERLKQEYEDKRRGMVIVEIAGGYQMLSNQTHAAYIRTFLKTHVKEKLSKPSLETLAIIAYKQPISRGEIEFIRGVNSDGVVTHLLEKELIKIVGRKEIPGRPYLYGTTKQFLEYFGLKSLEDLPKLETLSSLIPAMPEGAMTLDMQTVQQQQSETNPSEERVEASSPPQEMSSQENMEASQNEQALNEEQKDSDLEESLLPLDEVPIQENGETINFPAGVPFSIQPISENSLAEKMESVSVDMETELAITEYLPEDVAGNILPEEKAKSLEKEIRLRKSLPEELI